MVTWNLTLPSYCRVSLVYPDCQDTREDKVRRWAVNELYVFCFCISHNDTYFISVFGEPGCEHQSKGHFSHFLSWQTCTEVKSLKTLDSLRHGLQGGLSFLFIMILPSNLCHPLMRAVFLCEHHTGVHYKIWKCKNCWYAWKRMSTILATKWMMILIRIFHVVQVFRLGHYCFFHRISHTSLKHITYNFLQVFFLVLLRQTWQNPTLTWFMCSHLHYSYLLYFDCNKSHVGGFWFKWRLLFLKHFYESFLKRSS